MDLILRRFSALLLSGGVRLAAVGSDLVCLGRSVTTLIASCFV